MVPPILSDFVADISIALHNAGARIGPCTECPIYQEDERVIRNLPCPLLGQVSRRVDQGTR